ncbi:hypothetical protein C0992_000906 [Termitomyces sp. T32_za158]|nr:hypothetical protein C0992_000906 [Termitomyces sp. T32_za158]
MFGRGYSPLKPNVTSLSSIGSLSLGLGLPGMPHDILKVLDPPRDKTPPAFPGYQSTDPSSPASILCPLTRNGISREELLSIWLTPPPEPDPVYSPQNKPIQISHCSPSRFYKYAKNQEILCIWYTTNNKLKSRINAISSSLPPNAIPSDLPPPEPPPSTITSNNIPKMSSRAFVSNTEDEIRKLVPEQFHAHLDVFDPIEVKKLPDH